MVGEVDTNLAVKSSDRYCPCFPQNFNYAILIPIMEIILATLFCSGYLFISLILHSIFFWSCFQMFDINFFDSIPKNAIFIIFKC